MTEFFVVCAILAGVAILLIVEATKWMKAHPTSPVTTAVETKLPTSVDSTLGLTPAVTGDHVVAAVQATGQAVATAVQAVAQAAQVPVATPTPPAIPLGPVGPDGKPTVVFPGGDLATFQAFTAQALATYGYGITIVNTAGQPLDVRGQPITAANSTGSINPGTDLAWTNGNHFLTQQASRTFTVTPPAGWTSGPTGAGFYQINATADTVTGKPPAFVRFTIGDKSSIDYMLGVSGFWNSGNNDFPQQSGPFSVTITMLDDNHNPVTVAGYGLMVQQNHG